MRSFLLSHPVDAPTRRIHLVCPINGACTVVALALCELLHAGCLSDFSCLTNSSLRRAHRAIGRTSLPHQLLERWADRGNLVLKHTISTETEAALSLLGSHGASALAGGFFTHQLLYLRDPVQQYLSQRTKVWCDNCGGFAEKFEAQDAIVRACLAARTSPPRGALHPRCPFHAVLFETDVLHGNLSAVLRLLRLPHDAARLRKLSLRERRARNVELGVRADHVAGGNVHASAFGRGYSFWQPSLASKHASWNCAISARVRQLIPTVYGLYHAAECAEPRQGGTLAADWISQADGRRFANLTKLHQRHPSTKRIALVCDAFLHNRSTNCQEVPHEKWRAVCYDIGRRRSAGKAPFPVM
ncbi:hypothetical protein AB1Y20_001957 [Prymnesium parvum]|uniref:Uncharacterized protein n=1 Tax=Prymnesium parvum TaxID=97485 RepID=A0AB34J9S2_PRYPA